MSPDQNKQSKKKIWIIALAVLIVLAASFAIYKHYFQKDTKPSASNSQYTKGESSQSSSKDKNADSSSSDNTSKDSSKNNAKNENSGSSSVNLQQPSGNFVSSHHTTLNSSMVSVCNTSPNVTCTITFVKDGVSRSLPKQTTDDGGSAFWSNWTAKKIGLTVGSWKITAVASSGDKASSADDAMTLEVIQ